MKRLRPFILLLVLMVFVTACGVDDELLPLTGTWNLESTSGGFGGGGFIIDAEVTMDIKGDDVIVFVDNSTLFVGKLSYESDEYFDNVKIDKTYVQDPVAFDIGLTEIMHFYVDENSLTLSDDCQDCFSYHFSRM